VERAPNLIPMPGRGKSAAAGNPSLAGLLVPAPRLFAVIFSVIWILHAKLLRLPYFWDEAGYFVPAARDLLLTGDPIPISTLTNAHPPLVMAWLAFWWKFSACTPAVTRTAMLLVAAFTLMGVFRLARRVSNVQVAVASTLLTALYPVFFAQSSLAHLDMMAAAFTIWGIDSYVARQRWRAVAWFALAGLAKETALLAPGALLLWECLCPLVVSRKAGGGHRRNICFSPASARTLALALAFLPLGAWLGYHYTRTGAVFGNPEYFRYNLGATVHPLRVLLAFAQRLWQLLAYLNMFVLTGAAALAMRCVPRPGTQMSCAGESNRDADPANDLTLPRIAISVQLVFAAVVAAYVVALACVGGAVLARYLLPVYPLIIIICVSTLWRRLHWWKAAVGMAVLAFVAGLFVYPPYRFAPEDNLAYSDFVWLHKAAAMRLEKVPGARVLTGWPATDELRKPYLGYVAHSLEVVPVENFTREALVQANQQMSGRFDFVLIFSTKYESPHQIRGWWERILTRYFDYHRDLPPQAAVELLGSRIIYEEHRGGEWVAIAAVR
jgi:hypothetical protein